MSNALNSEPRVYIVRSVLFGSLSIMDGDGTEWSYLNEFTMYLSTSLMSCFLVNILRLMKLPNHSKQIADEEVCTL